MRETWLAGDEPHSEGGASSLFPLEALTQKRRALAGDSEHARAGFRQPRLSVGRHARRARDDLGGILRVPRQDGHVALAHTHHQPFSLAVKRGALRRHNSHLEPVHGLFPRFPEHVINAAREEERAFRDVVMLALNDLAEAAQRFGDGHIAPLHAGILLRDGERLA